MPLLKVILLAPPAGGKGTFARMLADQYGVVEVGTGSLLRVHMREGTPLGKKAKAFVESGSLVPDELIISIIKQRLGEQDCREKGWVLDGFPRTGRQARALVEAGLCSGVQVVKIDVSDEIVTRRISNRRVDPVTGSVYHLLNKPPPSREIAQRLEQRKDDTETVIRKRLGIYKEHVGAIEEALRAHVRKLALVQPSAQAPDDYSITFRRIIARLDQSIMLFSRL